MSINLAICVIIKNFDETTFIKLKKYFNLCNQLIVVAESSVIESQDILKVYIKHFNKNYSEIRNYALSKVKNDWVFFLDSDEEMSQTLSFSLESLIKSNQFDGYWFPRRNYISDKKFLKYGLFYPDLQLRLFRLKPEYFFIGKVHEIIQVPMGKTKKTKLEIYHFPRNPKYSKFSDFKNMIPYIEIEKKELVKDSKSGLWYIIHSIIKSLTIFLSGYFRGKGILDGWAGFRAHVIFSFYIFYLYFFVGIEKLKKNNV